MIPRVWKGREMVNASSRKRDTRGHQMGNARGLRVLFNIMLNLILSPCSIYALSMLYLCSGYGVYDNRVL